MDMRSVILNLLCCIGLILPLIGWLAEPASAAAWCFGRRATITGTRGDDKITGTEGNDVIVTFSGTDGIDARGGADRICSGAQRDLVDGGRGHDRVRAGSGDDVILSNAGRDRMFGNRGSDSIGGHDRHDDFIHGGKQRDTVSYPFRARSWVDLRRGLARLNGRDQLRSIENVRGGPLRDVLRGDSGSNHLWGGASGNDVIVGRGGDDVLGPGDPRPDGHLRIYGGTGYDLVSFEGVGRKVEVDLSLGRAWIGDRRYLGHATGELHSVESVAGSRQGDLLRGDAGDNLLAGGWGRDVLLGGAGQDLLFGDGGNDVLVGDEDNDVVDGGVGEDLVAFSEEVVDLVVDLLWRMATSSHGSDTLISIEGAYGTPADDELRGDDGSNLFFGLGGDDLFFGAAGDDWLEGGQGVDDADGGDGQDTCLDMASSVNCERFQP